jgi:hypothetical protein
MHIQVGTPLMMVDRGLVLVDSVGDDGTLAVHGDDDTSFEVAAADVADVLRAVATPAEAKAALALSSTSPAPDTRAVGARAIGYLRLLESATLANRMRALVVIAHMDEPGYAEDVNGPKLEALVAAELGAALGTTSRQAKRTLRTALDPTHVQAPELPDRSDELRAHADFPDVNDLHAFGAFAIERSVCVGEHGYCDAKTGAWAAPAKPGVWRVYTKLNHHEIPHEIVACHHESVAALDDVTTWKKVATLSVEGGQMMVADKDASLDDEFQRERFHGRVGILRGRAALVGLGCDGRCTVFVVPQEKPVARVRVTVA